MIQTTLITAVLDWERRLELTEERRREGRTEPWQNFLAPLQKIAIKTRPAAVKVARSEQKRKELNPAYVQECCPES